MNKVILSSILGLCSSFAVAQTPVVPKVVSPVTAQATKPVTPVTKPVETPKTVVLQPKQITQGELAVSSDAAVKEDAQHLFELNSQLEKTMQDAKIKIGWDDTIKKINGDIEKVRKFNGWDNTVIYNLETGEWSKTTPEKK
jgi:hypothetical protein